MANTIDYAHAHIYYFIMLFVIITLFSIAGVFRNNEVITNSQFSSSLTATINKSGEPSPSLSPLKWRDFFKDIFSFFFWNISIYDGDVLIEFLWIIRIIFVYVPLLSLIITLWYSVPTVSG